MTMKPDDFEGLVEFRARVLHEAKNAHHSLLAWEHLPEAKREFYRILARASIIAEYEAGIVPCPRIPTVNMNAALWQEGGLHGRFGRALSDVIAASPYTPPEADNDKG